MVKKSTEHMRDDSGRGRSWSTYRAASHRILQCASAQVPRIQFLRDTLSFLREFSDSDGMGLVIRYRGRDTRCRVGLSEESSFEFAQLPLPTESEAVLNWASGLNRTLEDLCRAVADQCSNGYQEYFTEAGSFACNDLLQCRPIGSSEIHCPGRVGIEPQPGTLSWILAPVWAGDDCIGLMSFESRASDHFPGQQIGLLEQLVQTFGVAFTHRQLQVELRERIKELSCLYSMARLVSRPEISLDNILNEAVELLPPGWLYPEITLARVTVDETEYTSVDFGSAKAILKAEIVVRGKIRGTVEVGYAKERPVLDEGPFLREERNLIDAVAGEISRIVEQYDMSRDRQRLQEQLLHADRLATIGQLAAGVAHELNEPLASILGFAQLSLKSEDLSEQTGQDIQKITSAALHAREVIRKLLVFAREKKADQNQINLNDAVANALYFLESRCVSAGIEVVRNFSDQSPQVIADQSQVVQILTNLVVNSMQAMPNGGRLTVGTTSSAEGVGLSVEDSGRGMSRSVREKMFDPFFTTKTDDQGTGLGLSVVHGIIGSMGGSIDVRSELGKGTKITILFPPVLRTREV